jgi:hypothetical protein
MSANLLDSPAVDLLLRLEREGFAIAVTDGRLLLRPVDRLSESDRLGIRAHRAELIALIRLCGDDVQQRRGAFRRQLDEGVNPGCLALHSDVPYVAGCCFSCGLALAHPHHGKCDACALAWRLVMGLSIPSSLASEYAGQKVVA